MKKKHQVVVEVSFDNLIAEKHAAQLVHGILVKGISVEQAIYETDVRHDAAAIKVAIKQGSRVIAAAVKKERAR